MAPRDPEDGIDLERVVTDPEYRRFVIERLNAPAGEPGAAEPAGGGAAPTAEEPPGA